MSKNIKESDLFWKFSSFLTGSYVFISFVIFTFLDKNTELPKIAKDIAIHFFGNFDHLEQNTEMSYLAYFSISYNKYHCVSNCISSS